MKSETHFAFQSNLHEQKPFLLENLVLNIAQHSFNFYDIPIQTQHIFDNRKPSFNKFVFLSDLKYVLSKLRYINFTFPETVYALCSMYLFCYNTITRLFQKCFWFNSFIQNNCHPKLPYVSTHCYILNAMI